MGFNLAELDLSNNKVNAGGTLLPPGKYLAKIAGGEVQTTAKGGNKIQIDFEEINGVGKISGWYNVYIPASQEATRIGRDGFKSLCFFAGHPNPDKPGDLSVLKGKVVGIGVVESEYEKNGVKKKSVEVKFAFDPAELDPSTFTARPAMVAKAANGAANADIPF